MRGIGELRFGRLRAAACAAMLCLTGCALLPQEPPPEPVIEEPPVAEPPPAPPPPPPVVVRPPPSNVAIVLTSRQPAYEDVATQLGGLLGHYTVYDLSDRSQTPVAVFRRINDAPTSAVVAIGLRAARSAVAMARVPVVFSQVFNYQDDELLTDNSRGVMALAPLDAHLGAWKEIDPELARVGAIIGPGHDSLVAEARAAADRHGVELNLQTVGSDQETLYHFKRMIRDIDGFWLFPDNRVLSPRVLREILNEADRHQVQVAVSNEAMLSMGAAISVSSVASDIAATIVDVLQRIEARGVDDVPPLTGLSEVRVVTNDARLRRQAPAESAASLGNDE